MMDMDGQAGSCPCGACPTDRNSLHGIAFLGSASDRAFREIRDGSLLREPRWPCYAMRQDF